MVSNHRISTSRVLYIITKIPIYCTKKVKVDICVHFMTAQILITQKWLTMIFPLRGLFKIAIQKIAHIGGRYFIQMHFYSRIWPQIFSKHDRMENRKFDYLKICEIHYKVNYHCPSVYKVINTFSRSLPSNGYIFQKYILMLLS